MFWWHRIRVYNNPGIYTGAAFFSAVRGLSWNKSVISNAWEPARPPHALRIRCRSSEIPSWAAVYRSCTQKVSRAKRAKQVAYHRSVPRSLALGFVWAENSQWPGWVDVWFFALTLLRFKTSIKFSRFLFGVSILNVSLHSLYLDAVRFALHDVFSTWDVVAFLASLWLL